MHFRHKSIGRGSRSRSRSMAYYTCDIIKLCVLAGMLGVCLQSAISKFFFIAPGIRAIIPPPAPMHPDLGPCRKVQSCLHCNNKEELLHQCQKDINAVYDLASEKCKGYIKNLHTCRSSPHGPGQGGCRIEASNVQSCETSITAGVKKKWQNFQT